MGSKRRPRRVEMIRTAVKHRTELIKNASGLRSALQRIAECNALLCGCGEIAKKALEKINV